ncbi:MAG: hypothetical protein ACRBN8_32000 [Nannocystales bacterium]
MSRLLHSQLLLWLSLGALGSGCGDTLPPYEKVVEHRLLSAPVRVVGPHEPLDVAEGFVAAEALPAETVEVTAFAVGPDGPVALNALDLRWIACELPPGAGAFACLSESFPLSLDGLGVCDFPDLDDLRAAGEPEEFGGPCLLSEDPSEGFEVPVTAGTLAGASLELTAIGATPGGTPSEQCARELLAGRADVPNDCIYGVQVVPIGSEQRLLQWLSDEGIGDAEAPQSDEVDPVDVHPRVTSFQVSVLGDDDQPLAEPVEVPLGGTFEARAGQRLRVDVTSPEEDLQEYRYPVNGGADFETATEQYTGQWFITWGSLLSPVSIDADSYNEWTLESADEDASRPADEVAHLYYVVRDGRNGAENWWISVRFVGEDGA